MKESKEDVTKVISLVRNEVPIHLKRLDLRALSPIEYVCDLLCQFVR